MPKVQYQPFGMGQRMWIGFNFALQEIKIFLPKFVWRYKFIRGRDDVNYRVRHDVSTNLAE